MSDLIGRIRGAEPHTAAGAGAREAARRAAMEGVRGAPTRSRRGASRLAFALATATVAIGLAIAAMAGVFGAGADPPGRIVLPGDGAPAAHHAPAAASRPGIAATIVFRPVAGVTEDEAYNQMAEVIAARAAADRIASARVERVERDRAYVTLTGTREPTTLSDVVAGSAIAVYDLDDVLMGTFSSYRRAVLRARELAPEAPSRVSYLFRNGRRVRGPAPTAADLRRPTLPPGSQILGLPEGYAILRRAALFFVVRDQPAISPLQVVDARWPVTGPAGQQPRPVPITLTSDGRRGWDDLLARVSARAESSGRPQRIVVTTNGDIEQMTTADATGHLDTRPGSPALEFTSGITGSSSVGLTGPTASALPLEGSIPAIVWVADTYRVGAPPAVLGDEVHPLPAQLRRLLSIDRSERADLSTVRRALVVDRPDGQWSVWNYLLVTGTPRGVVLGPRRDDGFGFSCARATPIQDCGGSRGFQLFAVPAAARTLRFVSASGSVREAVAGGGWAVVLGPRGSRGAPPRTPTIAEALDASGHVIATQKALFTLP